MSPCPGASHSCDLGLPKRLKRRYLPTPHAKRTQTSVACWPRRAALYCASAIVFLAVTPGFGEEFVVGGSAHPWTESGITPGGVIAFVEDISSLTEGGEAIFTVEEGNADWIVPVRLDPRVNIALGLLDRGGSVDINLSDNQKDADELEGIINGDHRVAIDRKWVDGRALINNGVTLFVDLGARFGVNRIVFYPRMTPQFPFGNDFMRSYDLFVGEDENPSLAFPDFSESDNTDTTVVIEIDAQFVRSLALKSTLNAGFEIDEIEIYGTGFVPEAVYESDPLFLDDASVWGQIRWLEAIAGAPEDSSIEVRVRSGADDTPDDYYRQIKVGGVVTGRSPNDAFGNRLTRTSYERLLRLDEPVIKQTDAEKWGQWQLVENGQTLELPAPRQYFQFRIDFTNATLTSSRALAQLAFDFSSPPVDGLFAEVEPSTASISETTTFTFVTLVDNDSGREGFTRFDVETPTRITALHSVSLTDPSGTVTARGDFGAVDVGEMLPRSSGEIILTEVDDEHFSLTVPRVDQDGASIEIVFDSAVFRYGTRFRGLAFAEGSTLPLLTEGGNATSAIESDDLLVRVSIGSTVAGPLKLSPSSFSPNDDGINDDLQIDYIVQHLVALSPITVQVHDLSGRRVRQLVNTDRSSGQYRVEWDGRTDDGNLVPPGIYLIAVEVRSDEGSQRRLRQTAVIY